ncbi:hypothetical protein HDU67_003062, partial [Dinochytrium kinnereticum]
VITHPVRSQSIPKSPRRPATAVIKATIALAGAATGVGLIFAALITGTSRNPSLRKELFNTAILGMVITWLHSAKPWLAMYSKFKHREAFKAFGADAVRSLKARPLIRYNEKEMIALSHSKRSNMSLLKAITRPM